MVERLKVSGLVMQKECTVRHVYKVIGNP